MNKLKTILFVCSGNTCRSPMAKVILEEQLKLLGLGANFVIDSAGIAAVDHQSAHPNAQKAVINLFNQDLLATHRSKSLTKQLIQQADLILAMAGYMKYGLPLQKTRTLSEYAGESGDIPDPFGADLANYMSCAGTLNRLIGIIIPNLQHL